MCNIAIVLILWELISIIYFWNLYHYDISTVKFNDFISYLFGNIRWVMPTGHFWFIISLLGIYSIFPLLKIVFDHPLGKKFFLAVILYITFFQFIPNDLNTIQNYIVKNIDKTFIPIEFSKLSMYCPLDSGQGFCTIFFTGGGLMHNYFYIQKKRIKYQFIIGSVLIIACTFALYLLKGLETGFTGDKYVLLSPAYARVWGLGYGAGLFLLFVNIKDTFNPKIIKIISQNTLGIFYTHCLFLGAISYYIYPYLTKYYGIPLNILKSVTVLLLSLILTLICKKIPYIRKLFN